MKGKNIIIGISGDGIPTLVYESIDISYHLDNIYRFLSGEINELYPRH